MKILFAKYGQSIIMDSTHSIVSNISFENWKFSVMLVINGDGQSEAVCCFAVIDETILSLSKIFDHIQNNHNLNIVKSVITDKDMSERSIIKNYF